MAIGILAQASGSKSFKPYRKGNTFITMDPSDEAEAQRMDMYRKNQAEKAAKPPMSAADELELRELVDALRRYNPPKDPDASEGGSMTPQDYENWRQNVKGGRTPQSMPEPTRNPASMQEDYAQAAKLGIDEGLIRPDQFSKWSYGDKKRWLKSNSLRSYSDVKKRKAKLNGF